MNRAKEGESGEKHMCHVLEKPGGDDYEDPDKDLEENTATDYEIPVPLKEIWIKSASKIKTCSYSINNNSTWNQQNSVLCTHVHVYSINNLQLTLQLHYTDVGHICIETALSITPYSEAEYTQLFVEQVQRTRVCDMLHNDYQAYTLWRIYLEKTML